jgi:pimeloyl-ACP methyl ester carboxylesterase
MKTSRILLPAGAIASAGILAAIHCAYRRDIRKARTRISTGSSLVDTERGPIEYASVGQGMPLLVIHGAGGGFDQALDFANALDTHRFRCIFVSRFGYLRTPLPADGSPEAQADLYACLLDSLGISKAAIMGVSAGGPSAMQFAIRYPERCSALVLLVPAAFAPDGAGLRPRSPTIMRFLADTVLMSDFAFWLMTHVARRTLIRHILGTPFEVVKTVSPAEQQRLQTMMMNILPVSRRRAGLMNDGAVVSALRRFDLERIQAPTLLISLEDDNYHTFSAAHYTGTQIRKARFKGFRTGGHLWLGHNEEIFTDVREFLDSAVGSSTYSLDGGEYGSGVPMRMGG